jgi:hypothetical protein
LDFKVIETLLGVCYGEKKVSVVVADFGDFVFASDATAHKIPPTPILAF